MHQIMDPDKKYHPNEKWHLKKGSKAIYVEYWYPYDVTNKKAMTWEEYKNDLANGRSEKEFTLATRYTAVFNAHEVEGMPELTVEKHPEIAMDDLVKKLSEGMGVEILTDGGIELIIHHHRIRFICQHRNLSIASMLLIQLPFMRKRMLPDIQID